MQAGEQYTIGLLHLLYSTQSAPTGLHRFSDSLNALHTRNGASIVRRVVDRTRGRARCTEGLPARVEVESERATCE